MSPVAVEPDFEGFLCFSAAHEVNQRAEWWERLATAVVQVGWQAAYDEHVQREAEGLEERF